MSTDYNSSQSHRKRKWDDQPNLNSDSPTKRFHLSDQSPPPPPPDSNLNSDSAFDAAARAAAQVAAQYAKSGGGGEGAGNGANGGAAGGVAGVTVVEGVLGSGGRELNDPEFVKDIEINDIRNRYLLTKGPTQQQILADTGCSVTTKGTWYPDKSMATDAQPPLYLHLTAHDKETLDKGTAMVQEMIDRELGPLTEARRDRGERRERERPKWVEHKVFINLENLRNFQVRAKVVGPGGLFVKHIQSETGTRVQVKGQGSGFIENETGKESEDPMHIHISGHDQTAVDSANELAEDLLLVVREEWQKHKDVMDQWAASQQSYAAYGQNQQYMGYNAAPGYGQGYQAPYGQQMPDGGEAPPPPPPDPNAAPPPPPSGDGSNPPPPSGDAPPLPPGSAPTQNGAQQQDYSAYWQQQQQQQGTAGQQQPGEDPAAYWQRMMADPQYGEWARQYVAYYGGGGQTGYPTASTDPSQQQQQQPPLPSGGDPNDGAAPPLPPGNSNDASRKQGGGAYGAVPPPAGL